MIAVILSKFEKWWFFFLENEWIESQIPHFTSVIDIIHPVLDSELLPQGQKSQFYIVNIHVIHILNAF